jgi:hypothetical protein
MNRPCVLCPTQTFFFTFMPPHHIRHTSATVGAMTLPPPPRSLSSPPTGHRKIEVNEWDANIKSACALPALRDIDFQTSCCPKPWRGLTIKTAENLKEVVQKAARCWCVGSKVKVQLLASANNILAPYAFCALLLDLMSSLLASRIQTTRCMHSRRPVVHNAIALLVATFVACIPTAMRLSRVSAVYPLATGCAHEQEKAFMIIAAAVCIWLMVVRLMQYLFDALYVRATPTLPAFITHWTSASNLNHP